MNHERAQRTGILRMGLSLLLGVTVAAGACEAQAQLAAGPAMKLTIENWQDGMTNVTDIAFLSDGRAVITLKGGEVVVRTPAGTVKRMAAMFALAALHDEQGLLGVVTDAENHLYFYASTGDVNNKNKVFKASINADNTVTVDTANPIITMGLEGPANHDGGGMIIYKNQLYVGVGDTGANNTPPDNLYGLCLNKPLGKVLRVNLDGSVPGDNPLSSLAMVSGCSQRTGASYTPMPPDKRIWAWGMRNPWRIWMDERTELMWIGDVGEQQQEEITVGGKGANHGWPIFEGTRNHGEVGGITDCPMVMPAGPCLPPQDSYPHTGGNNSVTGGLIPPEGCGWDEYASKYVFADYGSGNVWTVDLKPDRTGALPNSRKPFATTSGPVSFRMGPGGALFIADYKTSSIVKITPKTVPGPCQSAVAPPPADGGAGTGGSGGSTGGSGGSGGRGGTGGTSGGDDGGCGCDLGRVGTGAGAGLGLLAAVSVLALSVRRRRRR
jgi:glucose/arabinose dehydrogenase